MEIFSGQNLLEFIESFKTDKCCKKYLSEIKWNLEYNCRKCGYTRYQERKDFSRTCNKCSHTESPTANTLFHKVKFGLKTAFFICFEMSTTTKSLSASQAGVRYGVTEKTARLFMHKVRVAMKSSEKHPITRTVQVDEFVVGGKETGVIGRSYHSKKKKAVCAVEYSEKGKIARMHAMKIDSFSSKSLSNIFKTHISKEAKVITDLWKGYIPLAKEYNITQIPSNQGKNFIVLHWMKHSVKSWLRTTYSWISPFNINRYFDEFCFRINRSQHKSQIFNKLIIRMVKSDKVYQRELINASTY